MTAELKISQRQRDAVSTGHHNYKTTGSHGSLERNTLCLPIICFMVIRLKHGLANFLKSHFFKLNHSSHASSLVWDSFCKVNNPEKWKPPLLPFSLNYQELHGKSFLLWWKLSFFSCQPFLLRIFRIGPVWQGSPLLYFSRGHVETLEFKIHRRAGVP